MKLKDFDYDLPKNLIAQKPVSPRDQSRLLVLEKGSGKIKHRHFFDLVKYLHGGDVLVLNNTKVMPARLIGSKVETGGRVEIFLLKKSTRPSLLKGASEVWLCLIGGKKKKENLKVEFAGGLKAEIIKNNQAGAFNVKFNKSGANFMKIVEKIGRVPLPPYIKRNLTTKLSYDAKTYQTVYADDKRLGSVAAPTAGFHFTPALLKKLKSQGVQIEYVTLQVGLGTFAPVKAADITKHKMHAEWIEVNKKTLEHIIKAKNEGRRIIAVGTTSVRTLESVFKNHFDFCHCGERQRRSNLTHSTISKRLLRLQPQFLKLELETRNDSNYSAWTDIFIYPGHKFKAVDAMITNFHLPKSTLLMLVSAFACTKGSRSAGREKIRKAYRQAVKNQYRFYSYGDAMLII